jgi:hypothetical protein
MSNNNNSPAERSATKGRQKMINLMANLLGGCMAITVTCLVVWMAGYGAYNAIKSIIDLFKTGH